MILETKTSFLLLYGRAQEELLLIHLLSVNNDQIPALFLQDSFKFWLQQLHLLLDQHVFSLISFIALEGAAGS